MKSRTRRSVSVAAGVLLAAGAAVATVDGHSQQASARILAGTASTAHLVVLVMENKEYSQIIGNPNAQYINTTLVPGGKLFTSYYAVAHPSLPNYLVLSAGQYAGCVTDGCPVASMAIPNLFSQMNQAIPAVSWRTYAGAMPSPCYTKNVGGYLVRHNPPVYYPALGAGGDGSCAARDLPLGSLTTDLQNGTLPQFAMVIPDQYNDMHTDLKQPPCQLGTAIQDQICQGDNWLAANVPALLSDGARNDVTLLVVFDEGTSNQGGGGHVVLVERGPTVCAGCTDARPTNHYGLVQAIDDWFGLPQLHPTGPQVVN